jgi:hypothetical protein
MSLEKRSARTYDEGPHTLCESGEPGHRQKFVILFCVRVCVVLSSDVTDKSLNVYVCVSKHHCEIK